VTNTVATGAGIRPGDGTAVRVLGSTLTLYLALTLALTLTLVFTSRASLLCGDEAAIMTLGSPTAHVPVRCASATLVRSHRAAALSQMPCAPITSGMELLQRRSTAQVSLMCLCASAFCSPLGPCSATAACRSNPVSCKLKPRVSPLACCLQL